MQGNIIRIKRIKKGEMEQSYGYIFVQLSLRAEKVKSGKEVTSLPLPLIHGRNSHLAWQLAGSIICLSAATRRSVSFGFQTALTHVRTFVLTYFREGEHFVREIKFCAR